ncbi:MAG: electron transfer flavoprotein subunit alpha/FixB family protein, partial [bacterium]|nr:electron transfer flavoprotein subunit alpha/FixB family protein [bacterium]
EREQRLLEGELDEQVDALVEILLERGLYGTWQRAGEAAVRPPIDRSPAGGKAVWVVAETLGGELRPVTFELLGKAAELASRYHGEVAAVLPGNGLNRHVAALAAYGADVVYLADDPRLRDYGTDVVTTLLAAAIEKYRPGVVLFGSTAIGRDLAPRLAARLDLGLTGDCIDLEVDLGGRLVQYKPAFGGNVVAPIFSRTSPEMATVRPGMLTPPAPAPGRQARICRLDTSRLPASRMRVVARSESEAAAAVALDNAEIVVGVGKGLGGPENLARIAELAEVLGGAALAATRPVADLGWLPRRHQVGLTGRAIAPELYVAVALRGALEHTVGIRNAG